jgi:hypothetical protein
MKQKIKDVARPLAPEDVRPGDYVAILNTTVEWPPWLFDQRFGETRIVRTVHLPCESGPLREDAVCLPFVLVENHKGEHSTLDVRRVMLARLSERYGARAAKRLSKPVRACTD